MNRIIQITSFFLLLLCLIGCGSKEEISTKHYDIYSIDSTTESITIKSVIDERLSKEDLIKITYKEREKRSWTKKFVQFFYLEEMSSSAYGVVSYLEDCSGCTDLDLEENKVDCELFKTEEKLMENFEVPDSIDKNLIIALFFHDAYEANSLILYSDNSKKEAKNILYFADGSMSKEDLLPISENEFEIVNTGAKYNITDKVVKYVLSNGSLSDTFERLKQ